MTKIIQENIRPILNNEKESVNDTIASLERNRQRLELGLSDGTKDLSVNSLTLSDTLTVDGISTFNDYINGTSSTQNKLTRTSSDTNVVRSALALKHESTANIVDGFGVRQVFYAEDNADTEYLLGYIEAIRDGADNTGKMMIRPSLTGTAQDILTVTAAGDVYTVVRTNYSSTSTVTGWGTPTKSIYYKKVGKTIYVWYYIYGTSNDANTSFTLPYASAFEFAHRPGRAIDNGAVRNGAYADMASGSSTVIFYSDMTGAAWTAAGDKLIKGQFNYEVA
jgi:hypothetical protein